MKYIKYRMKSLLSLLLFVFISQTLFGATYYLSPSATNAGDPTNYFTSKNGTGSSPSVFTGGHTWDFNRTAATTVNFATSITCDGIFQQSLGAAVTITTNSTTTITLQNATPFVVSGTGSAIAIGSTFNCIYQGSSTVLPTVLSGTYNNLSFELISPATSTTFTPSGNLTINGTLTVNSGVTLAMGANTLTMGASSSVSNAGSITFSGSSGVSYNNYTVNANQTVSNPISISGTLTIGSGVTFDMGANLLTLGINSSISNSGTIKLSAASPISENRALANRSFTGTIEYNGTVDQAVANGSYVNLALSNSSGTSKNRTLNGDIAVTGTLTVGANLKLVLNGKSITSVNAFSFGSTTSSVIVGDAAASIVVSSSSAAGTIYMDQTTALSSNRLARLTLLASSTLTLGNKLVLYASNTILQPLVLNQSSTLTSNTLASNDAFLELRYNESDDLHSAIELKTPTSGSWGKVTGEVLVEDKFYSGSRTYRQAGHALDSAMSLNQITDDFDLYGEIGSSTVGGRGIGKNLDGLYAKNLPSVNNSIFLYDPSKSGTARWVPFTTSSGANNTLPVAQGFFFFMRPSGSGVNGNYNAQIMDYEGQLNFSNLTKSIVSQSSGSTATYVNLLCNPYQSYFDLNQFIIDNSSVLSTGFYKYDKMLKTYDTYSKATGSWKKNGGSSLSAVVLDPGDAFWVYPNSGVTSVAFNLGQTVQTKVTGVDRTNKLEMDSVKYTSLGIMMNSKKDSTLRDFSMLVTRSGTFDLTKNPNDLANMSSNCIDASFVLNNGVDLMTVKCVSNKKSFVIPMFVKSCSFGSYDFHFNIDYNSSEISQFDLIDRYNNKITKIENGRDYSFEINSDSNSFGFNRFFINVSLDQLGSERLDNTQVSIYPNPISTRGVLSVYNPLINTGEKVSLIDLNGRILHCQGGKDGLIEMDLRTIGVTPGVYFVKYEINSVPFYSKLVVNNL